MIENITPQVNDVGAVPNNNLPSVILELDTYVEDWCALHPNPSGQRNFRAAIERLKEVLIKIDAPITKVVAEDSIAPYLESLPLCDRSKARYKIEWRGAFRWLCKARHLALAYDRCAVPAGDLDRHNPYAVPSGFAEAWTGVWPASIMDYKIARSIASNGRVAPGVKKDYRMALKHLRSRTECTREYHWDIIRKVALDLNLQSLKDVASVAGAKVLLEHFQRCGYDRKNRVIRSLYTIFKALAEAGLMGNPFKLKERTADGDMDWIIKFAALPEHSERRKFSQINGKRHISVQGRTVECRLRDDDLRMIKAYGNPALRNWRSKPAAELLSTFVEAQQNQIARTVLYHPPRPAELACMNWEGWEKLEGTGGQNYYVVRNNMRINKKKKRPDWVVPASFIEELRELWSLRRAALAACNDRDNIVSHRIPMVYPGVAMWINPSRGTRIHNQHMIKGLRKALLRIGIDEVRARHATVYWMRKGHQTFARNQSRGRDDKYIAEQAGHSEEMMRHSYDGPDALIRAEHLSNSLWVPLGVVRAPATAGSTAVGGAITGAECLQSTELSDLVAAIAAPASGAIAGGDQREQVWKAARDRGLLCSFAEASDMLDVEVRTLERWAEQGGLNPIHLDGHRYLFRAQVNAYAQCLTPDEAGRQLGLSGRQVRNLVHDKKIPGAVVLGKKILIPVAAVRAYQGSRRTDGGKNFREDARKTSPNVAVSGVVRNCADSSAVFSPR